MVFFKSWDLVIWNPPLPTFPPRSPAFPWLLRRLAAPRRAYTQT